MIDINDALNLIAKNSKLNLGTKKIKSLEAVDEILAKDIIACKNLPCFDNSALDGYAYKFEFKDELLEILSPTIFAGDKNTYTLEGQKCYKIMTGAKLPDGCDSVARIEDVEIIDNKILIKNPKKGDACKIAAEDVKSGDVLLKKGEILTPSKIMLLCSQGIDEVEVYKKPCIALFSSGNEIKEPWEEADDNEIYNANIAIFSLLKKFNFECEYKGVIADDFELTLKNLDEACKKFDVIITSGGASVGDADFMQKAMSSLNFKPIFNHIDIKPGKPMKCYENGKNLIFILPGNPMPAYLLSFLIIIASLKRLSGACDFSHFKINAKLKEDLKLKPNRQNIILGFYNDGYFLPFSKFGSGMITPLVNANSVFLSAFEDCQISKEQDIKIIKLC